MDVGTQIAEWNRKNLDQYDLPLAGPNKDTGRDAGLHQGDPGNTYPPNTPNKPQDFRMNLSRDVDETHRGNQPSETFGGRDASETHNPKTRYYKSQTSEDLTPKFYDRQYQNQELGIRSSSPLGAASPRIRLRMQDYSHGAGNAAYHVNIPTDQCYPPQESAYYEAYQGDM